MSLVIRAEREDLEMLSRVIAEAFFDLPPSRWLVPDPDARRAMFPAYFGLHLEQALAHGVVWTIADRTAAALWLPTGRKPVPQAADYGLRLAAITGARVRQFTEFDAALERHHPSQVFHHHLAIMAVRADRQGRGFGSALLRAHHRELDQGVRIPAYLEASSQRSRRLYERHGYVLRAGGPFALPAGGPLLWPMWRERSRRAIRS